MKFLYVTILFFAAACGSSSNKKSDDAPTPPPPPADSGAVAFSTVEAIIADHCAPCHIAGGRHTAYVGNEANVKTNHAEVLERITAPAGDAELMPPARANKALSDDEKATLTKYLSQPGL